MNGETKHTADSNEILFGDQTRLTLRNMSFSGVPLARFPMYILAAAQVKKACALANSRAKLLPPERAGQIHKACDLLIAGKYTEQFPVDVYHGGGGIGINMNFNEVIAALAGEDIQALEEVNLSQSTSDVCHTSLRLALIDMLALLDAGLAEWIAALEKKAEEFAGIDTIGRTCWQDGMRVPVSVLFEGLLATLERQKHCFAEESLKLTEINLGWTVIGTGIGASDAYRNEILSALREVTGKELRWRKNPLDSAQYPDDLARVSGAVRRLAEILGKFARDLRLLSSGPETGLRELTLPAVQKGSSFFPGKVNPVIPETMIQCSMLIGGHDSVIQTVLGLGETHLNVWEEMMGFLLMDSIGMLSRAMDLFLRHCVVGIGVNRDVCESYAASKMPLIVDAKDRQG